MNLFLDETGMLIAKKNDAALRVIQRNVNLAYAGIDGEIPRSCPQFEAQLFGQFYAEWKKNLGVTLLSHAEFYQRYCVLYDGAREAVAGGIRGMRLLDDIITDMHIPLSDEERRAYARCVARLDEIDWQLDDPLRLPDIVDVFDIEEVPRMAYAAQLRADIEHFHYYSVLSDDPQLDRVNAVFCRYLLAHRSQHIAAGNFWRPTVGRHGSRMPAASAAPPGDERRRACCRMRRSSWWRANCWAKRRRTAWPNCCLPPVTSNTARSAINSICSSSNCSGGKTSTRIWRTSMACMTRTGASSAFSRPRRWTSSRPAAPCHITATT